ncbi:hypothetical protein [Sinorhizobium fredii]
MPQKENKLQKLTLMLGQTVAAMRVNEMLTCRLLRWIAAQTDDPQRFIAEAVDDIRNELRSAAEEDGSTVTAEAAKQALEYLDNLGAEMLAPRRHKRASAEIKDLSPLDEYRFPPFTSALDGPMNGTVRHPGSLTTGRGLGSPSPLTELRDAARISAPLPGTYRAHQDI